VEIDVYQLFSENTVLVVFAAIALGHLVGNAKVGRFQLGATGGVLLCALVFGHFGFKVDPIVQSIGFTLFIYSVGWQAGPQILNVLGQDGFRYIAVTLFVSVGSVLLVMAIASVVGLENSYAAGLLAGGLTNTPTLVGAQNAVASGMAAVPEGATRDDLVRNISVAYAITYVFGTVGLLLLVRLMPSILKIELAEQAEHFARERGFRGAGELLHVHRPILRAYAVEHEQLVGKTLREVESEAEAKGERGSLYRIKRGNDLIEVSPDTTLRKGDKVFCFWLTPTTRRYSR